MASHLWLTFALAYLATTITPGPNVLLIVRNALRYGPAGMGATWVGNMIAQLVVTTAVAMGVGAMLLAIPSAFLALKVLGAGYLIYLGLRQLLARAPGNVTPSDIPVAPPRSKWRIGSEAFVVCASNPKLMIFLCAFLPQFLEHDRPLFSQFAVMYMTIAAVTLLVHSVYCYTALRLGQRLRASRWVSVLRRASGALFVGMGVRLLGARAL